MLSSSFNNFQSSRQTSLLDPSSKSLSDKLMSEAKPSNFQFLINFQGIHKILNEDGHILVFLIDRVSATTDEYDISSC